MTVTVYTKPNCVQCSMTFKKLEQLEISNTAVDITENPEAYKYVTETLGYMQAPVVVWGDQHWSGFQPDRLAQIHN